MLKKLVFLSSVLILSACATNPEGMSSEEFASTAKLSEGYNFTEITGEKIRPDNLTEKNGLLVMKADATLVMKVGEDQTSTLIMNLQFLDNYQRYNFVTMNDESQKVTLRKITVRQCDDQCSVTQYMAFNIKTDALINAREEGLVFSINKTNSSEDFIFKIPSNYIDGLLKRAEVQKVDSNVVPVKAVKTAVVAEESKAVEMSKYWFNKLDEQEQVLFSTWSIKSSKKQNPIVEGSKELDRLNYWYQEADIEQQKILRIWAVENIK